VGQRLNAGTMPNGNGNDPRIKQVGIRQYEDRQNLLIVIHTSLSTAMRSPNFPPSMDPEGFDREQFHEQINGEVRDFLDKILKGR
jgi:hypothetical protein